MYKNQIWLILTILSIAISVACIQNMHKAANETSSSNTAGAVVSSASCKPIETRRANVPEQQPTFPGQTRTCAVKSKVAFEVTVLAKGLVKPWAVEPLPNGDLLITEKTGQLRIVSAKGSIGQPIGGLLPVGFGGLSEASGQGGLPPITALGQGGLLDVALSPDFTNDQTIFWSFSEQRKGGSGTSVARGRLTNDRKNLEQVRVIFRALPTYDNGLHFGSRLAFGPDKMLYITLGDRFDRPNRPKAQQLDTHLGKIIRIDRNGSVPADNPFAKQSGAMPEIWTIGHRNIQSATFDKQGRLWTVEMGPQGGDELNLIEKGENYGWPVVTFGEEYSDDAIAGAVTARKGYEHPVYYWDPVIAPSGAQFYTGKAFPAWRGSLFVGALREKRLVRLVIKDNRVTGEEHLLIDRGQRIRDVRQGSDGELYIVTDDTNGELWKITPKP
jgi:aldose sugar dehydrogenase